MKAAPNSQWLFPAALLGKFRDCRKNWQELLKRAWQTNSWEAAMANEPTIDVRADETDIVYEIGRGPIDLQMQTSQWWVSYAGDLRPTKLKSTSQRERDQALLYEGLQFLWYVIGHLGKHSTLPYLYETDRYFANRDELHREIASAVIHWLPEIFVLSPRFAQGASLAEWQHARICPHWVVAIRQSILMAGHRITSWPQGRDIWLELLDEHLGDPAKFLEIMRIIEPHQGRYRLGSAVIRND